MIKQIAKITNSAELDVRDSIRTILESFLVVALLAVTAYGVCLLAEHLSSPLILNHSFLHFTPQLMIGAGCLVLGAGGLLGAYSNRATL